MVIAIYGSQESYLNHLLPLARAWPDDCSVHLVEHRGWQDVRQWAHENIPETIPVVFNHPPERGTLTVIAAYTDLLTTRHLNPVLVEHGSGQRYGACPSLQSGSYSGGPGRDDCRAFLVPNQAAAAANEATYPSIPNYVVGSPWMETLRVIRESERSATTLPTVVISTHWDGVNLCPELASALPHFAHVLGSLAADPRWNLAGHCHPRARSYAEPIFERAGIPFIADLRDVVRVGDLYVCDNSSSQFETAACGIPQLLLNSPHYRKEADHGGRFWSKLLGMTCDDPGVLHDAVWVGLQDSSEMQRRREEITREIYDPFSGTATLACSALRSISQARY